MNLHVDVQVAVPAGQYELPDEDHIRRWLEPVLAPRMAAAELSVRIVDEAEIGELNARYRHKPGPTNVLSFPFEADIPLEVPLLGDLVICAAVVEREAREQDKPIEAHWAHMLVHGTLHLLGYDHVTDAQAHEMETTEIQLLQQLGFSNPYEAGTHA